MGRVARLWLCIQLVGDVLQVLTERAQDIGTDVAPQDDPAVRRDGNDKVGNLRLGSSGAGG